MTKPKPTPEQIQRACDLANERSGGAHWRSTDYGRHGNLTALADTIAQLDAKDAMIDGQAALIATLTAERDEARAVLDNMDVEIDRLLRLLLELQTPPAGGRKR